MDELSLTHCKYECKYHIVDADFIVLILDNNYGAKTDWGISGTEEEYEIAIRHKKKIHI